MAERLRPPEAVCISPACVGVWLSLVEHLVRDEGVAGSNPATPTSFLTSNMIYGESYWDETRAPEPRRFAPP
jgi:hypothetical protein